MNYTWKQSLSYEKIDKSIVEYISIVFDNVVSVAECIWLLLSMILIPW